MIAESNEVSDVKQICEQVKQAMIDNGREMCDFLRVERYKEKSDQ